MKKKNRSFEIIETARRLLAEGGPSALTLRQVADTVGIKLASLQYHFPTKADLITGLVSDVRKHYYEQLGVDVSNRLEDGEDPETVLISVIRWIKSPKGSDWNLISRIEVQLWAMAFTDPVVSEEENKSYYEYRRFLSSLIRRVNPELSRKEAIQRGAMMSVMIDGTVIIKSVHRPYDPELKDIDDELITTALELARRPPTDAKTRAKRKAKYQNS